MSELFASRRVIYASSNATKPSAAMAFMMQFGVQREGAAHLRDRLTLRLLSQHTAQLPIS